MKAGPFCLFRTAYPRFYFNSTTQQCQAFEWGGCEGNENNFNNIKDCQETCHVKVHPCYEQLQIGPCDQSIPRYYFNVYKEQCEIYWWGGCEPKRNNFLTVDECQETCPIIKRNPCLDAVKSGPCKDAITRYYFDTVTQNCEVFIWSGCGDSENNFENLEKCELTCPVQTRNPCLHPKESGPCLAAINRFHFDPDSRKCEPFYWGGCNPNSNNFETIEECQNTCEGEFWKP